MFKKVLLFSIICSMLSISTVFAAPKEKVIRVYIEGDQLTFTQQPFVENDITLVQFRPVFEKLGLKIEWNVKTQTITGSSDKLTIKLTIGSTSALINDKVKTLALAPRMINGNTMIPLRFVSEASGKETKWYNDTRVIQVGKQLDLGEEPKNADSKVSTDTPIRFLFSTSLNGKKYETQIRPNSIGTPELILLATNVSDKDIVAFEFTTKFLDQFDRPVNKLGSKSPLFEGIVQNADLKKLKDIDHELGDNKIQTIHEYYPYKNVYVFNLALYDLAFKVDDLNIYNKSGVLSLPDSWEIQPTKVKFSDGTIWEADYYPTYPEKK